MPTTGGTFEGIDGIVQRLHRGRDREVAHRRAQRAATRKDLTKALDNL